MSVLTSVNDYCRAIGLNTHVVKLVEFLDKYLDNTAQFSLSELKEALKLARTCKNTLPELQMLLAEIGQELPELDVSIVIDRVKAHIEFLSPRT